jgi:hypothetical protein
MQFITLSRKTSSGNLYRIVINVSHISQLVWDDNSAHTTIYYKAEQRHVRETPEDIIQQIGTGQTIIPLTLT